MYSHIWASLVVQIVKNPPTRWETWVRSLGQENPLEKGTATHSSILAWKIPWTEGPGGLQSMGSQRVRHDLATFAYNHIYPYIYSHIQNEFSFKCTFVRLFNYLKVENIQNNKPHDRLIVMDNNQIDIFLEKSWKQQMKRLNRKKF